ncbi:MAG: helicase-related protein [Armatimonadota bacterium]|nr:helicase-related protein [Armatimonadota bacterium]
MDESKNIQLPIGQRIRLPGHFDTEVLLEDARPLTNGYECRVRLPDNTLRETIISLDEARELACSVTSRPEKSVPVDAEKLRLLVESCRIRLAYAHDQQFAVSLSGIRTLPHQIEAVYQKMLPQPRLRFLLADDPGAGKTIMAGLLIKELRLREAVERILILCPAPLTIQWQDELLRWFNEDFVIIFSAVDQQQLRNPWEMHPRVIASIDYAKQDPVRERVWQQPWDLVVIDEAHKCSARTTSGGAGREPKVDATKRYELASKLADKTDYLLLLTATPHHGDEDRFAHFLRLLDSDLFPEPHRLKPEADKIRKDVFKLGADCPWALRRLKEDLKDLNGQRLFPDRHAKTVSFRLNSEEYALYKAVTEYINEFIPQQTGQRRSSAALTRTVLQRRLASSTSAIYESLKRRLRRQENLLEELRNLSPAEREKRLAAIQGQLPDPELEEDDLDEAQRDQLIDDFTVALELQQIEREIAALRELVEQARRVKEHAVDSKLAALRKCLAESEFAELKDGRGKLLIFTEHRDTLSYLRNNLESWGYTTCEVHGGMNPHERKRAQEVFRTSSQICVATEAAGEGINLQFCHLMINYDIPWNPTRLEQRLGRIHRIGQEHDCYVFNFVATESEEGLPVIEGRILHRLLEKLDKMKEVLEGRVFDVIGEVLSLNEVNLPEILREAAYDPRRLDEYIDQIDRIDPLKLKEYEEATGIALARAHVDFTGFQRRNLEIEERRLMPRYVEDQFLAAAKEVGLQVERRADKLLRIEHVPAELRSERLRSVEKYGKPESSYRKVTFHKEHLQQDEHMDAVLIGPGHALYAAVDEKLNNMLSSLVGGVGVYIDPTTEAPYKLHFFEMPIIGTNSRGEDLVLYAELAAVKEDADKCEIVSSDILLDLPAHPNPPSQLDPVDPQRAADFLKSEYQLKRSNQCREDRKRYAQICRDYLQKSFEVRIARAQEKAMVLRGKAIEDSSYRLAADEAHRWVEELQRQREERLNNLHRLEIARPGQLRHIASAIVMPSHGDLPGTPEGWAEELDPETREKSEIEAENYVINYLIKEGFPKDNIERVGDQKIGFDIRAHRVTDETTGAIEVRRIEVKGRTRGQPIRLTTNEWRKAFQLGSTYWLAVVWDPLSENPRLSLVQNPAETLDHATREIFARYFEISAEAIEDADQLRQG